MGRSFSFDPRDKKSIQEVARSFHGGYYGVLPRQAAREHYRQSKHFGFIGSCTHDEVFIAVTSTKYAFGNLALCISISHHLFVSPLVALLRIREFLPNTASASVLSCADVFSCPCSYDQRGRHSTWEFGKQAVDQGVARIAAAKLTMGLPFYARDIRTGDWTTYEDIVKKHAGGSIAPEIDEVGNQYFNGVSMIEEKTRYALDQRLGGVMIWEVGQDNFINDESALHQENSLLRAISRVIDESAPNNGAKKDEL
eukprot:m.1333863 g.1333863  ORF g.1333863 m.1333863 type:complete len:254 (+) comp24872_c0_seq6:556-1317(+)